MHVAVKLSSVHLLTSLFKNILFPLVDFQTVYYRTLIVVFDTALSKAFLTSAGSTFRLLPYCIFTCGNNLIPYLVSSRLNRRSVMTDLRADFQRCGLCVFILPYCSIKPFIFIEIHSDVGLYSLQIVFPRCSCSR